MADNYENIDYEPGIIKVQMECIAELEAKLKEAHAIIDLKNKRIDVLENDICQQMENEMKDIVLGKDLACSLSEKLGLDPNYLKSMTIKLDSKEAAIVTVESYVSKIVSDELENYFTRKYHLVEIKND